MKSLLAKAAPARDCYGFLRSCKTVLKDICFFFLVILGIGSYGGTRLISPKPSIYIEKSYITNTILSSDSIIRPSKKQIDLFSKDDFARNSLNSSPMSYFNIAIRDDYFNTQAQKYKRALNELDTIAQGRPPSVQEPSTTLRNIISEYLSEKKIKEESERAITKIQKNPTFKLQLIAFINEKIKLYEDIQDNCISILKDYLDPENYTYSLTAHIINHGPATLILSNQATIHSLGSTFSAYSKQNEIYIDQNQHQSILFTGTPPAKLITQKELAHECSNMNYEFTILDKPWYYMSGKVEGVFLRNNHTATERP